MKNVIIALLCCLVPTSVMAQSVKFGVKAGGNINTTAHPRFTINAEKTHSFVPGFNVGGVITLSLAKKFEIETDLMYSLKSNKSHLPFPHPDTWYLKIDYTINRHYLCLPIAAKYYVFHNLYVECGPELSFMLGLNSSNYEQQERYHKRNIDFGILGGIGYKINEHLFVNARYIHGLINEYKEDFWTDVYDGEQNRCIQLAVGYLF